MNHTPVKSGSIASVAHDPDENVLEVCFLSGATYRYEGVTADDHRKLMDAESIGKHFHAEIRGKYPHTKIEAEQEPESA